MSEDEGPPRKIYKKYLMAEYDNAIVPPRTQCRMKKTHADENKLQKVNFIIAYFIKIVIHILRCSKFVHLFWNCISIS